MIKKYLTNIICALIFRMFFIAICGFLLTEDCMSKNIHSECILNHKYIVNILSKEFSGGFLCGYGSTFIKIHNINTKFIVYNYIYRFLTTEGGVIHGGQRVIFFDLNMKYLGQFFLDAPMNGKRSVLIFPKKYKLILSDGDRIIGEILLSTPPSGILYNEKIKFFK